MNEIIVKWYRILFGDRADAAVLERLRCGGALTVDSFGADAWENLRLALFRCEAFSRACRKKGIPEEIVTDTLSDIALWADTHKALTGEAGLSETEWLERHLSGRLYKLGRLQFCMAQDVLEVHIPSGGALSAAACDASFRASKAFFKTYFPDFSYRAYTCHSWLLDDTLREFLKPDANILQFASRFTEVSREESYAALRYLFRWDTTRETLCDAVPTSAFAAKLKQYVLSGGKLYEVTGILEKPSALSDICPVCGKTTFSEIWEICPVCGWEHDRVQERFPAFAGGANRLSLNQAKAAYAEKEEQK